MKKIFTRKVIFIIALVLLSGLAIQAQTAAFIYQGRLTDSSGTAQTYNMRFRLFDAETGGLEN